ncbi:MAG: prepilin peptidase [Hyphomonadaceae bacterium]|nr:prepilin peptidase [Hyphomonadaceae bacterium]
MDYVIPFALVSMAAALLLLAAVWDVATMTIPNWLSSLMAASFPVAAIAFEMPWHIIALNVGFGAATLLGCFFLFNARILGGGDAKLIPAAAVWTGAAGFAPFALIMALVGGALALVLLALRRLFKPHTNNPAFLNRLLDRRRGAPYGVAIAAAGLFALAQTPIGESAAQNVLKSGAPKASESSNKVQALLTLP